MKKNHLILFIFLSLNSFCYSQSFRLHIKIALLQESKETLLKEGVEISLYQKGHSAAIQSVILFNSIDTIFGYDKDMSSQSLKSDTIDIWLMSRVRKTSLDKTFYLILPDIILKKDTTAEITVEFPENCAYNRNAFSNTCHKCKRTDKVIPIIYGLRDPIIDANGNISGNVYPKEYLQGEDWGTFQCQPTWYCKRDKLKF